MIENILNQRCVILVVPLINLSIFGIKRTNTDLSIMVHRKAAVMEFINILQNDQHKTGAIYANSERMLKYRTIELLLMLKLVYSQLYSFGDIVSIALSGRSALRLEFIQSKAHSFIFLKWEG